MTLESPVQLQVKLFLHNMMVLLAGKTSTATGRSLVDEEEKAANILCLL